MHKNCYRVQCTQKIKSIVNCRLFIPTSGLFIRLTVSRNYDAQTQTLVVRTS